jgi:beta-glucosidase
MLARLARLRLVVSPPRASAPAIVALALGLAAACGDDGATPPPAPISYGAIGPLVGDAGKTGFRFGAASAATQIEDGNTHTDWYLWTRPVADGGMGKGREFIGDAVGGYTRALTDVPLITGLHLDSYRFSVEWARVEPTRDAWDEPAFAHYGQVLDALVAAGVRPMLTVHHFSNPVWIADPRDPVCANNPTPGQPTDTNLCGLGGAGGPAVIAQMAQYAGELARRYGDRVDEWGTLNEPVNYLLAAYGIGTFPPGRFTISTLFTDFIPIVRDYLAAHAAMYDAIKANDTIDADGDGVAAAVGLTLSVADWTAAGNNQPSTDPRDVAARDKVEYVYHYLPIDAITRGGFDADLDGQLDEDHPDWRGKLDWLGVQYYFRTGVRAAGDRAAAQVTPCFRLRLRLVPFRHRPTYRPTMGYEAYARHLRRARTGTRYPSLPLVVARPASRRRRARRAGTWSASSRRSTARGITTSAATTTEPVRQPPGGPRLCAVRAPPSTAAGTCTATLAPCLDGTRTLTAAQRGDSGAPAMTPEPGVDPRRTTGR